MSEDSESQHEHRRRYPLAKMKGGWTSLEDQMLKRLVEEYGAGNWSVIARHLNTALGKPEDLGRIGKQCRERFNHHLRPGIKKDAWTEEEESLLVTAHLRYGNRWSDIARNIRGRTENAVKNHWNATLRRKDSDKGRATAGAPPQSCVLRDYMTRIALLPGPLAAAYGDAATTSAMLPVLSSRGASPPAVTALGSASALLPALCIAAAAADCKHPGKRARVASLAGDGSSTGEEEDQTREEGAPQPLLAVHFAEPSPCSSNRSQGGLTAALHPSMDTSSDPLGACMANAAPAPTLPSEITPCKRSRISASAARALTLDCATTNATESSGEQLCDCTLPSYSSNLLHSRHLQPPLSIPVAWPHASGDPEPARQHTDQPKERQQQPLARRQPAALRFQGARPQHLGRQRGRSEQLAWATDSAVESAQASPVSKHFRGRLEADGGEKHEQTHDEATMAPAQCNTEVQAAQIMLALKSLTSGCESNPQERLGREDEEFSWVPDFA